MKIWLGLLFFFLFESSSFAVFLIGVQDPKGDFQILSPQDPQFTHAVEVVSAHQWTRVRKMANDARGTLPISSVDPQLLSHEAGAEEKYVNLHLASKEFGGRKIQVKWVPTTLWDLFVTRSFLLDPEFARKASHDSYQENYAQTVLPFFEYLRHTSVLPQPTAKESYSEVILALLKDIHEKTPAEKKVYRELFETDYEKAIQGKLSNIENFISLEILAYQKNQTLLWRATSGVPSTTTAQHKEDPVSKKVTPADPISKQNKEYLETVQINTVLHSLNEGEPLSSEQKACFEKYNREGKIGRRIHGLYPMLLPPALTEVKVALDIPVKLNSFSLKPNDLAETPLHNLSYAYSPLAGILFDGPTRRQSACTYTYMNRDDSPYTYAIFMDRDWELKEGQKFFYLPDREDYQGVFGNNEFFHPRTIGSFDQVAVGEPPMHKLAQPLLDHVDPRLKAALTSEIKKLYAENGYFDVPEKQITTSVEKAIARVELISKLGELISKNGQVVNIRGRVISDSKKDAEAQAVMSETGVAAGVLKAQLLNRLNKPGLEKARQK